MNITNISTFIYMYYMHLYAYIIYIYLYFIDVSIYLYTNIYACLGDAVAGALFLFSSNDLFSASASRYHFWSHIRLSRRLDDKTKTGKSTFCHTRQSSSHIHHLPKSWNGIFGAPKWASDA